MRLKKEIERKMERMFGISKVAEGFDSEQSLPVDITYKDIIEWLTDRKKIKKEWNVNYKVLKGKLDKAQKDLLGSIQQQVTKEDCSKIVQILQRHEEQEEGLVYNQVKQIFDLLLKVENTDKSLLGYYNSAKLKEWNTLVKSYESDNLHLAEASQILNSNIKFIIPSMKDEINKTRKYIDDCERRKNECLRSAKEFRNKYAAECVKYGVKGNDVRSELDEIRNSKKQLNEMLDALVKNLITSPKHNQNLDSAVQLYEAFINFILALFFISCATSISIL